MEGQRISIKQLCENYGVKDVHELLQDNELNGMDGTSPALCDCGELVEPDGECPHGHPSILIALGLI